MINIHIPARFSIFIGMLLLAVSGISNSYAQAPTVDFGGTWNTVTSKGKKIVLTLRSTRRTAVTGTYARNGLTARLTQPEASFVTASYAAEPVVQSISSIEGTVTDKVLRFKWVEDGGRGAGKFTMSPDGRSFQGTFSRTDNPDDTSGGTWNGVRQTSFHGVWQTKVGEQFLYPQLLLQQSGDQITGHLVAGHPDLGVIKDGVVDGDTLKFLVWRPDPRSMGNLRLPDIPIGKGELVMNADRRSFSGTILGASVVGTRIGR